MLIRTLPYSERSPPGFECLSPPGHSSNIHNHHEAPSTFHSKPSLHEHQHIILFTLVWSEIHKADDVFMHSSGCIGIGGCDASTLEILAWAFESWYGFCPYSFGFSHAHVQMQRLKAGYESDALHKSWRHSLLYLNIGYS